MERVSLWRDGLLWVLILGGLWGISLWGRAASHLEGGLRSVADFDLSLGSLPFYALCTFLRMSAAFIGSLVLGVSIGVFAVKSARFRPFVLSVLDLLQSIPVLGFMSLTAGGFLALFPHRVWGAECACIFAIFTSQVWNLAFAFYQSLSGIPPDLEEVATACGLSPWQRFFTAELPATFPALLWNGMLSFGCGWFFVAQCETFTVLQSRLQLPGLGSFVTVAIERGALGSAGAGLLVMLGIVVACDQLVWRPLLVWADKFRIELTEFASPPPSWFHSWLAQTALVQWCDTRCVSPLILRIRSLPMRASTGSKRRERRRWRVLEKAARVLGTVAVWGLGVWLLVQAIEAALRVWERMDAREWQVLARAGGGTLLRVLVATFAASLVWVPVGIWMGQSLRVARAVEPIAQMAAAFPINLIFPWMAAAWSIRLIPWEWGSVLLMTLASQWYVLFNVLAGVSSIPAEMYEAARVYRLRGWNRWRVLLLPAVFPYWVTGACTAAGGAWNASIVSEVVSWGSGRLSVTGLGAMMVEAFQRGDTAVLWGSLGLMSVLVLLTNKLLWRPLYSLAEKRFHLD